MQAGCLGLGAFSLPTRIDCKQIPIAALIIGLSFDSCKIRRVRLHSSAMWVRRSVLQIKLAWFLDLILARKSRSGEIRRI
jgi:hypothetical protein